VSSSTAGVMEGVLHSFNASHRLKMSFTVDISQRWAEIGGEVRGLKPKMKSVWGKYGLVPRLGRKLDPHPGLVPLHADRTDFCPPRKNMRLKIKMMAFYCGVDRSARGEVSQADSGGVPSEEGRQKAKLLGVV
jgi:hypothetical protein